MDSSDLINFSVSPTLSKLPQSSTQKTPGKNPFDDLFKPLDPNSPILNLNQPKSPHRTDEKPLLALNDSFGQHFVDTTQDLVNFLAGDIPRESLGILNLEDLIFDANGIECHTSTNAVLVPKMNYTLSDIRAEATGNVVPTVQICNEFLTPSLRTFSSTSSTSFHSNSLEDSCFSRIPSISSSKFNMAFADSDEYLRELKSSTSEQIKTNSFQNLRPSSSGTENEINVEDDFSDDLVFTEARHLALQLSIGSLLNQSFLASDILDTTSEPPEFNEILEDDFPIVTVKCDTEEMFNQVDRKIPNSSQNGKNASINSSPNQNSSKSKDAKEILSNLSAIINNDNLNDIEKMEGQNLLCSLADMIDGYSKNSSNNKINNLDDSGNSSIGEICNREMKRSFCEVSDTSITNKSVNLPTVLSKNSMKLLAKKSHSFTSVNLKVPQQLSANKKTSLSTSDTTNNSNGSDSNIAKGLSQVFKHKKRQEVRKGPIKAVVPIKDMTRDQKTTPYKFKVNYRSSKTSTPISNCELKPMAQSTPDGEFSLSPKEGVFSLGVKLDCPSSLTPKEITPSRLPQPKVKQRFNNSIQSSPVAHRRSTGDISKPSNNSRIQRSFSIGRDPNILSPLNKVKESIKTGKLNTSSGSKQKSHMKNGKENAGCCT